MKKKTVLILLAFAVLCSLATGAYAANSLTKITANLNGELKFRKDGKSWRPVDANGKEVLPITYNGTTYLPLRVIGDAFDIPILWEGTTKTIGLGETEEHNLYSKDVKVVEDWSFKFLDVIDKKQLVFNDKQYNGAYAYSANHANVETYYLKFDFGQKYDTFHLIVYPEDDMKLKVYNGDKQQLSQEISLSKGELKEIDVDLQGSRYAYVYAYDASYNSTDPHLFILKDSSLK